jgi:hypothetical protein
MGRLYGAERGIVFYMQRDFAKSTQKANIPTRLVSPIQPLTKLQASISENCDMTGQALDKKANSSKDKMRTLDIWQDDLVGIPYATLVNSGKKSIVYVSDGIGATNRFLDKVDNSRLLVGMVSSIAPKGSRIVFVESSLSNSKVSLLEVLAPWSLPAWWQAIFLIAISIYIAGKRFGLPEETRYEQRGSKEMSDAIADTTARGHVASFALTEVVADCERRIRQFLKIGRDVSRSDLVKQLPAELAVPLSRCIAAMMSECTDSAALDLCKKLQNATDQFTGTRYRTKARKRKSR